MSGGQVVDTQTALEFMQQTLQKVSPAELGAIALEAAERCRRFQALLKPDRVPNLTEDELRRMLRSIFGTRRRVAAVLAAAPPDRLRAWTFDLIHGEGQVHERFQAFVDRFGAASGGAPGDGGSARPELPPHVATDLASELLHAAAPGGYWLWTRWMWDPRARTGSLPLVTMDFELQRPTPGETYLRVGEAVTFVHHVGEAAGFQRAGVGVFGTDVYLACVYVIYIYTVLKMRMTQEFNQVIPDLPEIVRRLLGIYRMEV